MSKSGRQIRKTPGGAGRKQRQLAPGTQVFDSTWKYVELVVASQHNILVQLRDEDVSLTGARSECRHIADTYQAPVRLLRGVDAPAEQFDPHPQEQIRKGFKT